MKAIRLSRFDRVIVGLLAGLALVLVSLALAASWRGLKPPALVSATVATRGPVGLAFSQKMRTDTVQSRVSLEPQVSGRFSWDGNTLWFWPNAALQPGQPHTLRLAPGALSEDGQEIKAETRLDFQVRAPQLVYLSPAAEGSDLWISDSDGKAQTQLTKTSAKVIDFGISFDGEQIAFSSLNTQQGTDLWVIRRDGSQAQKLLDCGGDTCSQPAWSPDGKRIAYSRTRLSVAPGEVFSTAPRIWTVDYETLKTAPLFQDPATSGVTPSWSPDGRFLAFYSPVTKVIHALNVGTGKDLLLRSQSGVVGAWTADSRLLFYGDLQSSDTLPFGSGYYADVETDQVSPLFTYLSDAAPDITPPIPAPDGSWVVVGVNNRGGSFSSQLVKMKPDGSGSQTITNDHLYTHGAYRVDPTGRLVVFQRFLLGSSAAKPEVWVWEADTGSSRRIAQNAALPAWLP